MSDQSQGPEWWLASDGKWYPPELAPGTQPQQPPAGQPPAGQPPAGQPPAGQPPAGQPPAGGGAPAPSAYPIDVQLDSPLEIARWRAFLHIFMAIPQLFILYFLSLFSNILAFISFFTVLFAKKVPPGIQDIQAMFLRYANRTGGYVLLMTEEYPPFKFDTVLADPGDYPLTTQVGPTDELDRWRCLQPILLIPHIIVLGFIMIAAFVVYIINWFAVVFTGASSEGMRDFLVNVGRWATRVNGYARYLSDQYPPFSFS